MPLSRHHDGTGDVLNKKDWKKKKKKEGTKC
jgi:hypothetical protein